MAIDETEIARRMDLFAKACRESGAKRTHQRMEIFREVAQSGDHPDVETVHRRVRKRMPTVSLDTVYRTLWWLKELGLVNTLGPPRERTRFDANLSDHHHFMCTHCGVTWDFNSDALNHLSIAETVQSIGSMETMHLEVKGICHNCTVDKSSPT